MLSYLLFKTFLEELSRKSTSLALLKVKKNKKLDKMD